jgi:hypothetical protein
MLYEMLTGEQAFRAIHCLRFGLFRRHVGHGPQDCAVTRSRSRWLRLAQRHRLHEFAGWNVVQQLRQSEIQ